MTFVARPAEQSLTAKPTCQTVGSGAVYIPGAADEGCTLRVVCTPPSLAGTTYSIFDDTGYLNWAVRSGQLTPVGMVLSTVALDKSPRHSQVYLKPLLDDLEHSFG